MISFTDSSETEWKKSQCPNKISSRKPGNVMLKMTFRNTQMPGSLEAKYKKTRDDSTPFHSTVKNKIRNAPTSS